MVIMTLWGQENTCYFSVWCCVRPSENPDIKRVIQKFSEILKWVVAGQLKCSERKVFDLLHQSKYFVNTPFSTFVHAVHKDSFLFVYYHTELQQNNVLLVMMGKFKNIQTNKEHSTNKQMPKIRKRKSKIKI